ncbi:hypothetical protein [Gracilimonas amylolytica]|uniref:hypothetical protein n=1 Tax=Gracilimonas amylolytica TaxID=1749045 RepID=UPI000CD7F4BB|nr:hypothetical protein [Gracilimonas amylolytica]
MIQRSNVNQCARVISDILNPLVLPVLVFGVAGMSISGSTSQMLLLTGVSAVFFLIIPLSMALIMRQSNKFQTLDFKGRTSRNWLYLSSVLSVLAGYLIFEEIFVGAPEVLMLIYLFNLIIAFLLNLKWKISVHTGSMVTAIILLGWIQWMAQNTFIPGMVSAVLLLMLPFVIWSRLHLKVHSRFEVILGGMVSLISTLMLLGGLV